MAAPARKPARKAQLHDVVDDIAPPAEATEQPAGQGAAGEKRPVGRPPKRWLIPFSSKIEIGLRQELDAYLAENNVTIVDFLDTAIRNQLKAK